MTFSKNNVYHKKKNCKREDKHAHAQYPLLVPSHRERHELGVNGYDVPLSWQPIGWKANHLRHGPVLRSRRQHSRRKISGLMIYLGSWLFGCNENPFFG